jgi:hypothetical protein
MQFGERPSGAGRLPRIIGSIGKGVHRREPVNTIPSAKPLIRSRAGQRPGCLIFGFGQPSVLHEIVLLQLAVLFADYNSHSFQRGGDDLWFRHCVLSLRRDMHVNFLLCLNWNRPQGRARTVIPKVPNPRFAALPRALLSPPPGFPQHPAQQIQNRRISAAKIEFADFLSRQAQRRPLFRAGAANRRCRFQPPPANPLPASCPCGPAAFSP